MLAVTIQLISAVTGKVSTLGRMYIANDGTGTKTHSDYDVAVCRKGSFDLPSPMSVGGAKATRTGKVTGYAREAFNVWRLIARAVIAAFPEERSQGAGTKTTPDHRTMRGLALIALAMDPSKIETKDEDDVKTALLWITAACAEGDEQ